MIGQAKGVLSQQQNLDMDAAFTLLRAHARGAGRRLLDVATDVVATLNLTSTAGTAPAKPAGPSSA